MKTFVFIISGLIIPATVSVAQNMLSNGNFDSNNQHYRVPFDEISSTYTIGQFQLIPSHPNPLLFDGPIFPGQFDGDNYNIGTLSGKDGIEHWDNPFQWIEINTNDPNCTFYGYGYQSGNTTNPNGKNNYWTAVGSPHQVKTHAADWYKEATMTATAYPTFGAPYPDYFYDSYVSLYNHNTHSGNSYVGMKTNSLIQQGISSNGVSELSAGATYRFSAYIKPVLFVEINPYLLGGVNGSYFSDYYSWDQPAKLNLLFSKHRMTYQDANCTISCSSPLLHEKKCEDIFQSQQLLYEYTIAEVSSPGYEYPADTWLYISGIITAPSDAADLHWLGIELDGNCDSYILIDDIVFEPYSSSFCESDVIIENNIMESWTSNFRSSSNTITFGPEVIIEPNTVSRFIAAEKITINPGTNIAIGSSFFAGIGNCSDINDYLSEVPAEFDYCNDVSRVVQPEANESDLDISTEGFLDPFPNPANTMLVFSVESDELIGSMLTLTDFSGREVVKQRISSTQTNIDVKSFSNGIYLYRIIQKEGKSKTGRIIISH